MFNKDVTHSKMRRKIENPRVLLLDCPLEYKKGEVRARAMRFAGGCGEVCSWVSSAFAENFQSAAAPSFWGVLSRCSTLLTNGVREGIG